MAKRDKATKTGGNTTSGQSRPGFEWTDLYKEIAETIAKSTEKKQWIKDAVSLLVPKETENSGRRTSKKLTTPDLLPDSFYKKDGKHEESNLRDSYDPFSFFALFNYNDEKRIKILKTLKESGKISKEIPDLFHGIPSIYNSHVDYPSRSNDFNEDMRSAVVNELWELFDAAMKYKDSPNTTEGGTFATKYDVVKDRYGSRWFTTTSILYEMCPDVFLPLDSNTREFLLKYPDLPKDDAWKDWERSILTGTAPTGEQYLDLITRVNALITPRKLGEGITDFPTLSHNAWKESLLLRTEDLLESSHQLILTGAPGTGKTYTAKLVANRMITKGLSSDDEKKKAMDDRFQSVQFHPGYDYSDFVIGMKPVLVSPESGKEVFTNTDGSRYTTETDKEDGVPEQFPPTGQTPQTKVSYKWKYGVFKKFADIARKAYDETKAKENAPKFVFFIDEINRADLSRVFGEIFSLLEEDYRYPNEKGMDFVQLPNGERFYIPKNLYIIGTMNDIDRSVESMDFALRRRFAWLEVEAEESKCIIEAKKEKSGTKIVAKLEAAMDALNEFIRGEKELEFGEKNNRKKRKLSLGAEYELGGAYFSKFDGERDVDEAYKKLWDNHLKIILNEYLRGEKDKDDILDALYDVYLVACKVKQAT